MHLAALNIPDLLLSLWRGSMTCETGDSRDSWDWAVLKNRQVWKTHGAEVAAATPYLPSSFDRPPRNPAEKINSGYKAIEFLTYLFVLGPGIFYGLLPDIYWRHFCRLVRGLRIVHQKNIASADLGEAHRLLTDFVVEFETLYVRRKVSRIHFCRPSLHGLVHICPETTRTGPYSVKSQWGMERMIGDLGSQIRQPSNPFANLAQRALRRCQVNAMKAMLPCTENQVRIPRGAVDLKDGYVLLCAKEQYPHLIPEVDATPIIAYLQMKGAAVDESWLEKPTIAKWGRLQLPNGQIARSFWQERTKGLPQLRKGRNVKVMSVSRSESGHT